MALNKAVEVNEAYRVLRDDLKRAEVLVALRGGSSAQTAAEPELLMTVMELRETLSEAKAAHDFNAVRKLARRVEHDEAQIKERLAAQLSDPASNVEALTSSLNELKYYRRFLDEVAVIEDEDAT